MAALKGQRVLIFGDSLSHRGSREAPVQVEVREGSSRTSSVPGDLLASYLLEAGASAARLDAKVSRSAYNFFRIENANTLLAADQAWKPTLAIIFLGTNDLGLNMDIDAQSMAKIRDAFRAVGADVWAVGPPSFVADKYSSKAPAVVAMMKRVFGENRFIDARPLTTDLIVVGRSSDGVHFTSLGAKTLAGRLAAVFRAALDTNIPPTVAVSTTAPTMPASTARTELHPFVKGFGFGLAALAFVGVGVIIKRRMTRARTLTGLGATKEERKRIASEIQKWDRLRMTQGKPKARKPVWFVDPDTGELIEVDYETAVFRGALAGLPPKKSDLLRMFKEALRKSEGDKRNQGTWEPVGDTEWEIRHFNVPSRLGYSKHVELRKIGHKRTTSFGKAYVSSVVDQLFREVPSSWLDQEDLKGAFDRLKWSKKEKGVYSAGSPHGAYIIDGNNYGRNRWTVTYPNEDYAMADSLREAQAWAEQDLKEREAKAMKDLKGARPYADSNEFHERMADVNLKLVKSTADRINEVARDIAREGNAWGGRKVFISDIAKRLGTKTERIAGPILIARNKGWLVLARADLPWAMDMDKVMSSEIEDQHGNRVNFVEVV